MYIYVSVYVYIYTYTHNIYIIYIYMYVVFITEGFLEAIESQPEWDIILDTIKDN